MLVQAVAIWCSLVQFSAVWYNLVEVVHAGAVLYRLVQSGEG